MVIINNGVIIQWFDARVNAGYITLQYPMSFTTIRGFIGLTSVYDNDDTFNTSKSYGGVLVGHIPNAVYVPLSAVGVHYNYSFYIQLMTIGI